MRCTCLVERARIAQTEGTDIPNMGIGKMNLEMFPVAKAVPRYARLVSLRHGLHHNIQDHAPTSSLVLESLCRMDIYIVYVVCLAFVGLSFVTILMHNVIRFGLLIPTFSIWSSRYLMRSSGFRDCRIDVAR